jgi:hypothetical protein
MNMVGTRPGIVVAAALAIVLAAVCVWRFTPSSMAGSAQPFHPLRGNFYVVWNADRDLVDIEIVGSTEVTPQSRKLDPERVLRFRLERAYVSSLLTKEPGFEIVGFNFDIDTRLPESLLLAVWTKGPSHRDIPGVPILPQLGQAKRNLFIIFHSHISTEALDDKSRTIAQCRGRQLESGLFENNSVGGKSCALPKYRPGLRRYIAPFEGDLSLIVTCWEEPSPMIDCELQFPFHGFGAELRFNHEQLPKWRAMVDGAIDFLKSKEYR